MKTSILSLSFLLMTSLTNAQEKTTIELPISICGQTSWEAISTSVTLFSEQEEVAAYELQGFSRNDGANRSGKVYYITDDADDCITLLLENVIIGHEQKPALIENRTKKKLVIHAHGRTVLKNQGSVIRSMGDLSIYGEQKEELDFDNSITIWSSGKANRSAIEAAGVISIQDLDLDMSGNSGIYGFRSIGKGEDGSLLIMNHVKGKVSGKQGSTNGFDTIEGTNCTVEGVKFDIVNEGEEEEGEEEEEAENEVPVVGGDFFIRYEVMGQHRFMCNLPQKEVVIQRETFKAMILPIETEKGEICWIEEQQFLYFDNVKLTTDTETPIVDSGGNPLRIVFNGDNVIRCAGDAFVSQDEMILQGASRKPAARLTVTTPKMAFSMDEGKKPIVEQLTVQPPKK